MRRHYKIAIGWIILVTRWCLLCVRVVKDATEYAEKNGMFSIETSAKTADNINQLFEVRNFASR